MNDWLEIHRGTAPLIVSFPHTGTDIPTAIEAGLADPWLARKDADWWIHKLYAFAADLGATLIRTPYSRTVIDVNRDPSGVSLYPGQATTGLCPVETFDGEALYAGAAPNAEEIARRRSLYFDPYHAAIGEEIARLRHLHPTIVLYDAHSIRSHVPRLFDGELPQFNIGTNGGTTCADALTSAIEAACDASAFSRVTNGRFRGGWITRHYGQPERGVHAIQMELACRGYIDEPASPFTPANWPTPFDATRAEPLVRTLQAVLAAAIAFAKEQK
ncbi:formiminoglutamase [Sphingomonas laterariae]|uniref:Formiminoglutamase n=1 Tax=Edaphosphingomonas laterariae TaxID=861865 RepID=A0A239BHY1_9SPHN|nr:N-formylglutamate deformylase [Sphingomonas laterariae]SNS07725.1 formiminoglutamase [Sphingomonas laterariae]